MRVGLELPLRVRDQRDEKYSGEDLMTENSSYRPTTSRTLQDSQPEKTEMCGASCL